MTKDIFEFIKEEYPLLKKECNDETYKEMLRMYLDSNYLKMVSSVELNTNENSYSLTIKYSNFDIVTIKRTFGEFTKLLLKVNGKNSSSEFYIENFMDSKNVFHNWSCPNSEYKNIKTYENGALVYEKSNSSKDNAIGKDVIFQYYIADKNTLYSKRILELLGKNVKKEFYAYADITNVDIQSFSSFDKLTFLNWHSVESEVFNKVNNEFIKSRRKNK